MKKVFDKNTQADSFLTVHIKMEDQPACYSYNFFWQGSFLKQNLMSLQVLI